MVGSLGGGHREYGTDVMNIRQREGNRKQAHAWAKRKGPGFNQLEAFSNYYKSGKGYVLTPGVGW